jgi:pyridoxamine 5'-phosphate oxidase
VREDFSEISGEIAHLRREHKRPPLDPAGLDPDPFVQFGHWMKDALEAGITLPNAMTLSTAGADGVPSARTVLLKGFDERGFVFYSNYESRKGLELEANPNASIVFYWSPLERQASVVGGVTRVSSEESDQYFASRPLGSKLGAWASRQSRVIESRAELEHHLVELQERYAEGEVPRPPYWGGYRLAPTSFEFWQSRPNRMHDRFRYRRDESGGWVTERLSP